MSDPKTTRVRATDELKREFSRRLLEKLASSDLNQSELARRVRVSKDAVSTYARGRSIPSDETLARIADELGCEPSDLLPRRFDSAGLAAPLRMTMLEDGRMRIEVSAVVERDVALKIMELIPGETINAG